MMLDDGVYEMPGGTALGIAGGRVLAAGRIEEEVRLRLGILRPDVDTGETKTYDPAQGYIEGSPEFAKGLVKCLLSIPDEQALKDSASTVLEAYAGRSFEPSWLLVALMNPFRYLQGGQWTSPLKSFDRKMSERLIHLPGFERWREAHKENLKSGSEDMKAQQEWIKNPSAFPEWIWTREDAEETALIVKGNPVFEGL